MTRQNQTLLPTEGGISTETDKTEIENLPPQERAVERLIRNYEPLVPRRSTE
jgi:hypothetical protein